MHLEPLDPKSTALVLIDLQQGIIGLANGPYTGERILETSTALVQRFHALGAPVVRVRVGWSDGLPDQLHPPVDQPTPVPPGGWPANWMDWPEVLPPAAHDIQLVKRQWGAFYGTELDLQMRRRGIRTLVLGGIATHIGVESTARTAWELGYQLILAEDAMSAQRTELHQFSIENILPRIGRIRKTADILAALPLPD